MTEAQALTQNEQTLAAVSTAGPDQGASSWRIAHVQKHHDYHLVNPSPWPLIGAFGGLRPRPSVHVVYLHAHGPGLGHADRPGAGVLLTMYVWWRDVIKRRRRPRTTTPRSCSMHHALRHAAVHCLRDHVLRRPGSGPIFDQFFRHADPEQPGRVEFMGTQWPPHGVELFDAFRHLPLSSTRSCC